VFQLSAQTDEISINLKLVKRKPVIPGFNITGGTQPFHAYLLPRLRTRGELTIGDESFDVSGDGWLDHAWGLVPLGRGQLGQLALNRFVVRLDDDRELLIFQLRRRDGSGQPLHSGLLIAPDGTTKALCRRDIVLETTRHWHSENSRIRYPAGWRLKLENADLTLAITPLIDDQELDLSLRYWAGAVTVAGQSGGGSVSGSGHVELTGYEP
jgi:predicted secreted hydrolase